MTAGRRGSWPGGGTSDGELLAATADRLRWHAPELSLVYARQAATRAGEAGDRALVLRAQSLVVAALVRLGRHAEAVEPAVSVLREAETAGERGIAGQVRVDLAASTRAVGLAGSAFVIVRPMLEGTDARPAVRAGALAEIVAGLAQAGRLEVIDEVLSEADRLYAADEVLSGDARRVLRALLCARIASFRRRWGNPTGAVAAATEGMALLDGLADPGADAGQARAELGLEMVSALLDAGEEAAALGQADQTVRQPVRAASAAALGRLMLILATRVHFPAGRTKEAHALLAEIVRVAQRHALDGLLADVLTSLASAQESDGELTEALNSLRSARAAEQRRLRADTLARLIVLDELGAGTRLPDDTEALLRRVVRTPARAASDAPGTDSGSREAASREMSGRELSGRGIDPGPRPRPNRGAGTYDSVGYERAGEAIALSGYTPGQGYDLEGYPTMGALTYEPATPGGGEGGGGGAPETETTTAASAGEGTGEARGRRSRQDLLGRELAGWEMVARERAAMDLAGQTRAGSDLVAADRAAPEWAGSDPARSDRARFDPASSDPATPSGSAKHSGSAERPGDKHTPDASGDASERAGGRRAARSHGTPEWAGVDPAAVDRVAGRAAVDRAAVEVDAMDLPTVDFPTVDAPGEVAEAEVTETEVAQPEWAANAATGTDAAGAGDRGGDAGNQPSHRKGKRSADVDKPKWPDPAQNERDEETGLLNQQGLRRRLAAARRRSRPTALTLVRLEHGGEAEQELEPRTKDPDSTDRFSAALIKAIDTAGAGSLPPEIDPGVLASLADHVRDMAPDDAELARPNEGELAVLLPDTTRDEAEQFAATLRETVSASGWDSQDSARGVSVSTGVAQYQEGTSEDALLSAAREALTATDSEPERTAEPGRGLPGTSSGYTYMEEYARLSGDGPDPEMAEYLAGFPLPDIGGKMWPSAESTLPPPGDAEAGEGGRSVLDRLAITRGSGGRRRAPDEFAAGQSGFDQFAIDQPMRSYSNTGDEILAAAEEAERASVPQAPEPDEVPVPPPGPEIPAPPTEPAVPVPPGGPEVPIPPNPDIDPAPGRRRRTPEPGQPGSDPDVDPAPIPGRNPLGPDIPVPQDPDADPEPRRRRWTSELDPENPRARRRALPRDPTRRAVEPDDEPVPGTEPAGRRRKPETASETGPQPAPETGLEPGAVTARQSEPATGRRHMPEPHPFEQPALSTRLEPPQPPADTTQATGRRRMPEPHDNLNDTPGQNAQPGRRRAPETSEQPDTTSRDSAPGQSTGRRRMPEALSHNDLAATDPEPTGLIRMPGTSNHPEPAAESESTGRRRASDGLGSAEVAAGLESAGHRRASEALSRSEVVAGPESAGRRRASEGLGSADVAVGSELAGHRRVSEALSRPEPAADPESTGRRRMPDVVSRQESGVDPGPVGRRGVPDALGSGEPSTGLESGVPDALDAAELSAGRRPVSDALGANESPSGAESTGRRRMPEALGENESPAEVAGGAAPVGGREAPGQETVGRRRRPGSPVGEDLASPSAGRRRMPESPVSEEEPLRLGQEGEAAGGRRRAPDQDESVDLSASGWRAKPENSEPSQAERGHTGRRRKPDAGEEPAEPQTVAKPKAADAPAQDPAELQWPKDPLGLDAIFTKQEAEQPSADEAEGRRKPEAGLPELDSAPWGRGTLGLEEILGEALARAEHEPVARRGEPGARRNLSDIADDFDEARRKRSLDQVSRRRETPAADAPENLPGQATVRRELPARDTPDAATARRALPADPPEAGGDVPSRRVSAESTAERVPGQTTIGRRLAADVDSGPPGETTVQRRLTTSPGVPVRRGEATVFRRHSDSLDELDRTGETGSEKSGSEETGPGQTGPGQAGPGRATASAAPSGLPPEQSGPVDLDDFPRRRVAQPPVAPEPSPPADREVFSLGPDGLSRRGGSGSAPGAGTSRAEPVEGTIQSGSAPVDELSRRRQSERQERLRRRAEQAGDGAADQRPSRFRRRERSDVKLADLLAEALVAYQSSTSGSPSEDILSAYEGIEAAHVDDTAHRRGETGN